MKIIFILLFIFIGLLFISSYVNEPFDNTDTAFITKYAAFMTFYNAFMPNWKQAIITSYGTSQPAGQPMSNPTTEQMNEYIDQLSQKEKLKFPLITTPLPTATNLQDILAIQNVIPRDSTAIKNALEWMNANLVKAHASMNDALKNIQAFIDFEPFNDICAQIQSCAQVQQCQQQQQQQQEMDTKKWMTPIFDSVTILQPLLDQNNRLIAKSKEIQAKAQSGDLLPKVPKRKSPYKLPAGSDALDKLSYEDKKNYQQNYGQYYAMKQMFNQINSVLR